MFKTTAIIMNVEIIIAIMFMYSTFPFVMSVNNIVKFRNGTKDNTTFVLIFIMKAIIPGKNDINVSGVNALCALLNVADLLATAIQSPLIKNE